MIEIREVRLTNVSMVKIGYHPPFVAVVELDRQPHLAPCELQDLSPELDQVQRLRNQIRSLQRFARILKRKGSSVK